MDAGKRFYLINKHKWVLKDFSVAEYRKLFGFVTKHNLKKFYQLEDGKYKILVWAMVKHLAMSQLLEGFLGMIIRPADTGYRFNDMLFRFKIKIKMLFGKSELSKIADEVLVEVLTDFFTGKVTLWKGLIDAFIPFWENIDLPLTNTKVSPE